MASCVVMLCDVHLVAVLGAIRAGEQLPDAAGVPALRPLRECRYDPLDLRAPYTARSVRKLVPVPVPPPCSKRQVMDMLSIHGGDPPPRYKMKEERREMRKTNEDGRHLVGPERFGPAITAFEPLLVRRLRVCLWSKHIGSAR